MPEEKKATNNSSIIDTLKKLWAPIAGFLGAVTLVMQFIQLWKGDQTTVTSVAAGLGAIVILLVLIWFSFSRSVDEEARKNWRYPNHYKLARAGLGLYLLASLYGGYILLQHRQTLEAKTVVLIATMDGPEDKYGITNELLEQLQGAVSEYEDIQIFPLGETITVEQGNEYAKKVGERFLADVVIWGWYRPTENPNITIHVVDLTDAPIPIFDENPKINPAASLTDLENFAIQQKLGEEMGATVLYISGDILYSKRDFSGALARFEKIMDYEGWSNDYVTQVGVLNYIALSHWYLEQYDLTVETLNLAAQLDPDDLKVLDLRAAAYLRLGQYEDAILDYDHILDLLPNSLSYSARGDAYFGLGQYEKALENYNLAISIGPVTPEFFTKRGLTYQTIELYEQALQDYNKAIQLRTWDPEIYLYRGITYYYLGEFENSIHDYDRVLELSPKEPRAYYNRGLTYNQLGEYEQAYEDFQRCMEFTDNLELEKMAKSWIEQLLPLLNEPHD